MRYGASNPPAPAQTARRLTSLWRQADFMRLWAGQTISGFGSAITGLALPLTAILILRATPREMGLLGAAGTLPALLFGLLAGVWVDRARRRPLLIGAELGRALLLGSVPALAMLRLLRMEYLYVVAFLAGTLALFFDVAITSFLPSVVRREELVEGNSKLQLSGSVTSIAGPGLAGALVQLLTAPLAIAVDALSFLVSGVCLWFMRTPETPPAPARRGNVAGEIGEGWRTLFHHPLLRAMTIGSALGSLAISVQGVVFMLFLTRELGLPPVLQGIILASSGFASLAGTVLAGRVTRRYGPGPAIIGGTLLVSLAMGAVPLAGGPAPAALALLVAAQVLHGIGTPIYSISQVSLRQAITPDRLLGRVNASRRFLVFGIGPLGALLGGFLGETIGLRSTLAVGAGGMALSLAWVVLSPLRTLREQPDFAEQPA